MGTTTTISSAPTLSDQGPTGDFVQDVAAEKRKTDREKEARRLVHELVAEAASLGITTAELRVAFDRELESGANHR